MNLIEAAKTMKPFRRPSDAGFYGENFWVDLKTTSAVNLGREDIVAEDWEVREEQQCKTHETPTTSA
jgi:hypothetical protein